MGKIHHDPGSELTIVGGGGGFLGKTEARKFALTSLSQKVKFSNLGLIYHVRRAAFIKLVAS